MHVKWTALALTLVASQVSAEPVKTWNHVIGERSDIEAAASMLAQASKDVRAGHARFKITCVDRREAPPGFPCDGIGLVRQIDLHRLHQVAPDEAPDIRTRANRRDWTQMVFFDAGEPRNGCGGHETLLFEVVHGPGRASKAVRAIDITRDRVC